MCIFTLMNGQTITIPFTTIKTVFKDGINQTVIMLKSGSQYIVQESVVQVERSIFKERDNVQTSFLI